MILLPTDVLFLGMTLLFIVLGVIYRRDPSLQRIYQRICHDPAALWAFLTFTVFWIVAVLDSIHLRDLSHTSGIYSLLDVLLQPLNHYQEVGYSAPFAVQTFEPIIQHLANGSWSSQPETLHILQGKSLHWVLWFNQWVWGIVGLSVILAILLILLTKLSKTIPEYGWGAHVMALFKGDYPGPWRSLYLTALCFCIGIWTILIYSPHVHILGTDKIGSDLLVQVIKSIRTAMILGIVTSLVTMPIALVLGSIAGLLGGWVDDVIYYIYTTLSSIPGILLIAASVLSLQIYWYNHPLGMSNPMSRADMRLLALCIILGLTSWTQLCRVLRAQTFKLREQDYILASRVQGVSTWRILSRHIMPNLLPILLISLVLDFSGLVLAEAVLTYVGVGVDPLTPSFGNLIDGARIQMAQTPVVWWPLSSTFIVMLLLVFAVNILADSVQHALNPRAPD